MKKETNPVSFAKRQWSLLVVVLTTMLVLSACGGGTATRPSASLSHRTFHGGIGRAIDRRFHRTDEL